MAQVVILVDADRILCRHLKFVVAHESKPVAPPREVIRPPGGGVVQPVAAEKPGSLGGGGLEPGAEGVVVVAFGEGDQGAGRAVAVGQEIKRVPLGESDLPECACCLPSLPPDVISPHLCPLIGRRHIAKSRDLESNDSMDSMTNL